MTSDDVVFVQCSDCGRVLTKDGVKWHKTVVHVD